MAARKRGKKIFLNRMKFKLLFVMLVFIGCMLYLGVQVYFISHGKGEQYEKIVLAQQRYDSIDIPYRRGDILDCNGTYLATSKKVYNLILEPKNINKDEEARQITINAITTYFDITAEAIEEMLSDSASLYKVALKKQDYEVVKAFTDFQSTDSGKQVTGVWFEEEYERYYPMGSLACHVLGFTASGNVGQCGIENEYNSMLNGTDGRQYGYLTSDLTLEKTTIQPQDGYNIISTIDANIQNIIEKQISAYMAETGAKNVSVLAMNPNNGEILALYNSNSFDPNNPYDTEALRYQFTGSEEEITAKIEGQNDEERLKSLNQLWRNHAINDTFEPGSTFKTFTVAAALEENVLSGSETFTCDGGQQVANYYIKCNKREGHGSITIAQAIAKSCNDALMQIADRMGRQVFAKYQTIFGFGLKTNVDLPGEAYTLSLIYNEERLNEVELACSSFGQGLNVSMIQLGSAFCSVVNGGNYYQPHVVKQIVDANGSVIKNVEGTLLRKTISEATSEKLRDYLFEVVETGTAATRCRIDGYTIGGKTGTAEKLPRGNQKYILSFICAVPIEAPQLMLYVTVDEPNVEDPSHSGIATVLSKGILEELLPYMNIFQSNKREADEAGMEQPEAVTPIFDPERGDVPDATGGDDTDSQDDAGDNGDGAGDQDGAGDDADGAGNQDGAGDNGDGAGGQEVA
ncbi:MAG: penicillin-binding protein 2 [Lachnospiraceae bacterium]|nr:penicillin-binding protein 2 [Lachnospiraceae bacterium]